MVESNAESNAQLGQKANHHFVELGEKADVV
jgi:hypothetical protein